MIHRLDEFTENSINLVTNSPYDDSWVVFILTDSKDYNMFVGSENGCAYTVKFSRLPMKIGALLFVILSDITRLSVKILSLF